jgi:hypothetical protein
MSIYTILAVGDVTGEAGLNCAREKLWELRKEYSVDFCVVNGENASSRNGIDPLSADALLVYGADIITTGNHVYQKKGMFSYLDDKTSILRPANFPGECPGRGYVITNFYGLRVLVINLMGTLFMETLDNPFDKVDKILKETQGQYDLSVLDFHAEATSEKLAMGFYTDGRVDFIFGTHTHVQTADGRVLPKGSGYITDIGQTGVINSVLGAKPQICVKRFKTKMPWPYEPATGDALLCGALMRYNVEKKSVISVQAIQR